MSLMRHRPGPPSTDTADSGAIAVIAAIMIPVFLVLCGIAIDIGRWYVEVQKVQTAADAAALGGVTWLPLKPVNAQNTAKDLSARNGFAQSSALNAHTNCDNANSGVAFFSGSRTSQLGVTVCSKVTNFFGGLFGHPTTVISRSALADFQAPTIMGSPCNALGNQPYSTSGAAQPADTVIPTVGEGGYQTCQTAPGFWLRMAGPATTKSNGDRYATKTCTTSSVDAECVGTSNHEYVPSGYIFTIRVGPAAVNTPMTLQIYDPAYIDTGSDCTSIGSTSGVTVANGMNIYVPNTGINVDAPYRAQDRYYNSLALPSGGGTNTFCSGDNNPGGASGSEGFYTSYVLRDPTATYNPLQGAPRAGCSKMYGFRNSIATGTLMKNRATAPVYVDSIAKTFHQWTDLCSFTPTVAGDYYLQVRTNLGLPTGGTTNTDNFIYSVTNNANNPIANAADSATPASGAAPLVENTQGHNIFALRLATQTRALGGAVSVSALERFPIFANVVGAQVMNLIQVPEGVLGRSFDFSFYDISDFTGTAILQVIGPVDTPYAAGATGCAISTGITIASGSDLNNCTVRLAAGANNGKTGTMTVPIPDNYECTSNIQAGIGECWYQVIFSIGNSPNEDTTWSANINGDPVRLLK